MSANDKQIGGNHYKNGQVEHWDLVISSGVGYLEGCATKYLSRAGKKGDTIEDLEKALHYQEKLLEMFMSGKISIPIRTSELFTTELAHFIRIGSIPWNAAEAIRALLNWSCGNDLIRAMQYTTAEIDRQKSLRKQDKTAGTPEDGGHHASQEESE